MDRNPKGTTYRRFGARVPSGPRSSARLSTGCRPRTIVADTGDESQVWFPVEPGDDHAQ